MKYIPALLLLLTLLAPAGRADEAAPTDPPAITADIEVVSEGYKFTEGPALAPDGTIYFTDIPNHAIHIYHPDTGDTTLFTNDSGGANGLMFFKGQLLTCAGGARELRGYDAQWTKADAADGTSEFVWVGLEEQPAEASLVQRYNGQRFNSPNDLAISDDAIYFTDPRYGKRDSMEMEVEAVYAVVENKEGDSPFRVVRLIDDLGKPNGIGLSRDQTTLYVLDNKGEKVVAYNIAAPDQVGPGRVLHDLSDLGGPDGMCVDAAGRLFIAIANRGIVILTPEGERLGFIETGPQTTNCCLGADGKTLYVTAEKALKKLTLHGLPG